jgi:hypothetical protein
VRNAVWALAFAKSQRKCCGNRALVYNRPIRYGNVVGAAIDEVGFVVARWTQTTCEKIVSDKPASDSKTLVFLKGKEDALRRQGNDPLTWEDAARQVRSQLSEAMNARHLSFLFGSGASSHMKKDKELGIPTMRPLADEFVKGVGEDNDGIFLTQAEKDGLKKALGLDLTKGEFPKNLEKLMEVLHSHEVALKHSTILEHATSLVLVKKAIVKVKRFVLRRCTEGAFSVNDDTVRLLYERFYRKLVVRDRSQPRPWVFTSNYDLFNETAMDRMGLPYANGFTGTVERRFNPAVFRYALAEQLDVSSRKWSAVDGFVYLCKLHGSVSWVEDDRGLFPIAEVQKPDAPQAGKLMIYPTPAKQNASFGSPYADLFREFQIQVVREQSVLVVVGYSMGDEHINNIIYRALTIPTFRLILLTNPDAEGEVKKLRDLGDPRIWIIGGDSPIDGSKGHYFDTFVEHLMPEPPGEKIDKAIEAVAALIKSSGKGDHDNDAG